MKKSLILGLSLTAVLALAGCSSSNEAAIIDRLSHQLDRTTNTVGSITSDTSSDLALDNISKLFSEKASTAEISALSNAYQASAQAASNVSSASSQIYKKVKSIKKAIAGGVKLGNENASAINELTSSMQKYTNSLNKTKSDYKNAAKAIYKLDSDSTEIDAKLSRLSCCVEARDCYMQNLLLTLENIEHILNGLEEAETDEQQTTETTQPQQEVPPQNQEEAQPPINNTAAYNPVNFNANNGYANGGYVNNGYSNGGYANWYPAGYGYNGAWRGGFNPDRNTDTYGPGVTNIDTYRFNGNGRRFQGSNGVNMIDAEPAEVHTPNDEEELSQETSDLENVNQTRAIDGKIQPKFRPEIKPRKNMNQLSAEENSENLEETIIAENQEGQDVDMKVRSVSTDIEEPLQGEDKVKGHTQTTSADINKKIEDLIKKAAD